MSDFDSHDHTCEINPNRSGSKADCSACVVIATEVADYEKYMEDRKAGKFDVSRIPTAELEALRDASLRYAATILNMAEKLDVGVEGLIPAIDALRAKADKWKSELDLIAKTIYPHEKDRFAYSVLGICEYVNSLRVKAEVGKLDTARLEFILSCLNKIKLFATFVNSYHPTRSTSQQRASDEEWRISIDEFIANDAMKERRAE